MVFLLPVIKCSFSTEYFPFLILKFDVPNFSNFLQLTESSCTEIEIEDLGGSKWDPIQK